MRYVGCREVEHAHGDGGEDGDDYGGDVWVFCDQGVEVDEGRPGGFDVGGDVEEG